MGLYAAHVLPRCLDWAMGGERFAAERPRCVGGVHGRVLEIGFGSGHNLSFYSRDVEELFALEPCALSRRLAQKRIDAAPFPVRWLDVGAERIPLDDESVDFVTSTWTLCTIRDVAAALREIRRVLKPTGRFHFLEHGRAPDRGVARWQDRLNPLQKLVGGGCHLNRAIGELVLRAGFALERLEEFYMPQVPRIAGYLYSGSAATGC